jgi:hypothetical protein
LGSVWVLEVIDVRRILKPRKMPLELFLPPHGPLLVLSPIYYLDHADDFAVEGGGVVRCDIQYFVANLQPFLEVL